jgi:predicted small secreted protein
MIRINKKGLLTMLIMVLSTGFTGCSNTSANAAGNAGAIRSNEIY